MTKNYKKNIKSIFTFLILFIAFFINGNSYNAKTALTCVYTDTNGDYKIFVKVDTNGKVTEYDYEKWKGESKTEIESESYVDAYWENGYWDITAFENRPNKNKSCPPYILGSFWGVFNGSFLVSHNAPKFVNSLNASYNSSESHISNNEKVLSYNESESEYHEYINNPRPLKGLYFKQGSSTSFKYNETTGADFNQTSITVDSDKEYMIYIKGSNVSTGDAAHLSKGAITCTTDNAGSIKEISNVTIHTVSGTPYNPVAYFKIKTGTPTQGTSAKITCQYAKNDDKDNVIVNKSGTLSVTVNNTNTSTNRTIADIKCEYNAKINGNDFTKFLVEIKNYNDGYTTFNENDVTFSYTNSSNPPQWVTANSVTTSISTCEHCNSNQKLYINLTKQQFFNALIAADGECPILFTSKHGGLGHGKDYIFKTTGSQEQRMERLTKYTRKTNGSYVRHDYNEDQAVNCTRSITFDYNGEDNVKTVTFMKNGNNFYYKVPEMSETEQNITSYVNGNTDLEIKIFQVNQVSSGAAGKNNYTQYFLKINNDYLKSIYNNMDGCSFPEPATNKTGPITTTNYDTYTKYYFNWALNSQDLPSEGTLGNEDENAELGGVIEGTGVDTPIGSGQTGELNLSAGDNTGDMTCDDYFGPEGSRNSLYDVLKTVITAVRIGTPILLILLTMVDFTKATTNDEALPKAKKHAVTRAIVAVIIFMLPSLVNLVFALIGMESCIIN